MPAPGEPLLSRRIAARQERPGHLRHPIAANATLDRQTLYPFGGSLAGTTLRVNVTACTPTS
jgi:hypothetical protein